MELLRDSASKVAIYRICPRCEQNVVVYRRQICSACLKQTRSIKEARKYQSRKARRRATQEPNRAITPELAGKRSQLESTDSPISSRTPISLSPSKNYSPCPFIATGGAHEAE